MNNEQELTNIKKYKKSILMIKENNANAAKENKIYNQIRNCNILGKLSNFAKPLALSTVIVLTGTSYCGITSQDHSFVPFILDQNKKAVIEETVTDNIGNITKTQSNIDVLGHIKEDNISIETPWGKTGNDYQRVSKTYKLTRNIKQEDIDKILAGDLSDVDRLLVFANEEIQTTNTIDPKDTGTKITFDKNNKIGYTYVTESKEAELATTLVELAEIIVLYAAFIAFCTKIDGSKAPKYIQEYDFNTLKSYIKEQVKLCKDSQIHYYSTPAELDSLYDDLDKCEKTYRHRIH